MPQRTLATPQRSRDESSSEGGAPIMDGGGLAKSFAHRFDDGVSGELEDRLASSGWQAVPQGGGGLGLPHRGDPIQAAGGPMGLELEAPVQADVGASGLPLESTPDVELPTLGGEPLEETVRVELETEMEADFGSVRVHASTPELESIGALAVTRGEHVFFAPGQYAPSSESGRALLSHELTHVLQQRAGRVQPTTELAGLPINDDPGLEQEADLAKRGGTGGTAAGTVVQGKFEATLGLPAKAPIAFDQQVNSVTVKTRDQNGSVGQTDEAQQRKIGDAVRTKQLTALYTSVVHEDSEDGLRWPPTQIAAGKSDVHKTMKEQVEDKLARNPDEASKRAESSGGSASGATGGLTTVATGFIDSALADWLAKQARQKPTEKKEEPEELAWWQKKDSGSETEQQEAIESLGTSPTSRLTRGIRESVDDTDSSESRTKTGDTTSDTTETVSKTVKSSPKTDSSTTSKTKTTDSLSTSELGTESLKKSDVGTTSKTETSVDTSTSKTGTESTKTSEIGTTSKTELGTESTKTSDIGTTSKTEEVNSTELEQVVDKAEQDTVQKTEDLQETTGDTSETSTDTTDSTLKSTTDLPKVRVKELDWTSWTTLPNLAGAQLDIFGESFDTRWKASGGTRPRSTETETSKTTEESSTKSDPQAAAREVAREHVDAYVALAKQDSLDSYRLAVSLLNKWNRQELETWLVDRATKSDAPVAKAPEESSSREPAGLEVKLELGSEIKDLDPGLRVDLTDLKEVTDGSKAPEQTRKSVDDLVQDTNPLKALTALGGTATEWTDRLLKGGEVEPLGAKLKKAIEDKVSATPVTKKTESSDITLESVRKQLETLIRKFVTTKRLPDNTDTPLSNESETGTTLVQRTTTESEVGKLSELNVDGVDWSTWEGSRVVQDLQLSYLQLQLAKELGTQTGTEAKATAAGTVVGSLMKQTDESDIETWLLARPLNKAFQESELVKKLTGG